AGGQGGGDAARGSDSVVRRADGGDAGGGGAEPGGDQSGVHPAGVLSAGDAGDEVRDAGGRGGERRAREESPREGVLRGARAGAQDSAGERRDRGVHAGGAPGFVLRDDRRDG